MPKYRKKPVVVEAIQVVVGKTKVEEVVEFVGRENLKDENTRFPKIITLEGEMLISDGDYIIKGVAGEFYPCKPEIFEATYEKVEGISKTTITINAEEFVEKFAEKLEQTIKELSE